MTFIHHQSNELHFICADRFLARTTAAFIYYAEKPRCCPFLLLLSNFTPSERGFLLLLKIWKQETGCTKQEILLSAG